MTGMGRRIRETMDACPCTRASRLLSSRISQNCRTWLLSSICRIQQSRSPFTTKMLDEQLFAFSSITTCLILAVAWLLPDAFHDHIGFWIRMFCIVILGIPHGALDHFLFLKANLLLWSHSTAQNAAVTAVAPRALIMGEMSQSDTPARVLRLAKSPQPNQPKVTIKLDDLNLKEMPRPRPRTGPHFCRARTRCSLPTCLRSRWAEC
jgi:hypothetical protein